MKHLYDNGEGELVVADTLEQAHLYHDVELGGHKDPDELADLKDGWFQVDDNAKVPIFDQEEDKPIVRTAAEWAAEHDEPTQVATTYY